MDLNSSPNYYVIAHLKTLVMAVNGVTLLILSSGIKSH